MAQPHGGAGASSDRAGGGCLAGDEGQRRGFRVGPGDLVAMDGMSGIGHYLVVAPATAKDGFPPVKAIRGPSRPSTARNP
jgi:hypothetical protein